MTVGAALRRIVACADCSWTPNVCLRLPDRRPDAAVDHMTEIHGPLSQATVLRIDRKGSVVHCSAECGVVHPLLVRSLTRLKQSEYSLNFRM